MAVGRALCHTDRAVILQPFIFLKDTTALGILASVSLSAIKGKTVSSLPKLCQKSHSAWEKFLNLRVLTLNLI